ncbi:MAG: sensor histidine kinase [Bacteroidota bacterium]
MWFLASDVFLSILRGMLCTCLFSWCVLAHAEIRPSSEKQRQQEFKRAMKQVDIFHNDSANLILSALLTDLHRTHELQTPFGLQVRLRQAEVLEKDHQDDLAIRKLLVIAEDSKQAQQWEVFANAQLSLARLREKFKLEKKCHKHLQLAKNALETHAIGTLLPRYYIRVSSFHRIFQTEDSARFYAKKAVAAAQDKGQLAHEGTSQLLLGMLYFDIEYAKAEKHFLRAGSIFRSLEDHNGFGASLINLTGLHLQNGRTTLAMKYNDSSLIAGRKAMDIGHERSYLPLFAYRDRGEIYHALGNIDSAVYYLEKSYEMELKDARASNLSRVAEIEEQYKDEKKAQLIRVQEQALQLEKIRRNWIIGVGLLVVIFSLIISYYYLRLHRANKVTLSQAAELKTFNEQLSISLKQQIMLQGEVHHRVKNNLQVIISLLDLQSEEIADPKALEGLEAMANRIFSIAALHELLYQSNDNELLGIQDYVQSLCDHYAEMVQAGQPIAFNLHTENQQFNLQTLMPIGIMLNELISNSLKYARKDAKTLVIDISLIPYQGHYLLLYRDNGPGYPKGTLEKRDGGLGTYLLNSMSRQLNGWYKSRNDNGALFDIFFQEKNTLHLHEHLPNTDS